MYKIECFNAFVPFPLTSSLDSLHALKVSSLMVSVS